MAGRFHGRVVIVTGGGKGIGAGCAAVFCQEGGRVAILDRDIAAGKATAAECTASGPGLVECWGCDVSDPVAFQRIVEEVAAKWGRIDCLINNAGVHPPATTIDDTSLDMVEQVMRINFLSTFAGAKFAVPY
ncbi:MAG TPA: SDR family NAD(P)-dependent oxidoreductase, partial [Planctomycetaceae bacterium]|nr:SDR family NAD(P)-dependent oxidoreductase [Planctomycetaceae bacterium]